MTCRPYCRLTPNQRYLFPLPNIHTPQAPSVGGYSPTAVLWSRPATSRLSATLLCPLSPPYAGASLPCGRPCQPSWAGSTSGVAAHARTCSKQEVRQTEVQRARDYTKQTGAAVRERCRWRGKGGDGGLGGEMLSRAKFSSASCCSLIASWLLPTDEGDQANVAFAKKRLMISF